MQVHSSDKTVNMNLSLIDLFFVWICIHHVYSSFRCTTPDGYTGICKPLRHCKPLQDIPNRPEWDLTLHDYLLYMHSYCEDRRYSDKVCCPRHNTTPVTVQRTPCSTTYGQLGECRNFKLCPAVQPILFQQITPNNLAYIEKSRCGSNEQYSICCITSPVRIHNTQSSMNYENAVTELREPTPLNLYVNQCPLSAFPPDPQSECCGLHSSSADRIIGGAITSIDDYPWLAVIEYRDSRGYITLACGGSLISGRYVLTASHCVTGKMLNEATPVNVRLGEYDISSPGPDCIDAPGGGEDCTNDPLVIPIEEIVTHYLYDPNDENRKHDIALIRLSEMATYTDFIKPICLPTHDLTSNPPNDLLLTAAGWGLVDYEHQLRSKVKKEVNLPYIPISECNELYNSINITLTSVHVCAGGDPHSDTCHGDSGGPLMYRIMDQYEVTGVISFGPKPCGQEYRPSVYTNVYLYLPWIQENIRN